MVSMRMFPVSDEGKEEQIMFLPYALPPTTVMNERTAD
jgi:hypothetical protein